MESNGTGPSGGVGFVGLLQVVFIVLKVTHLVGWKWWVVFLPFIASAAMMIALAAVYFVAGALAIRNNRRKKNG